MDIPELILLTLGIWPLIVILFVLFAYMIVLRWIFRINDLHENQMRQSEILREIEKQLRISNYYAEISDLRERGFEITYPDEDIEPPEKPL